MASHFYPALRRRACGAETSLHPWLIRETADIAAGRTPSDVQPYPHCSLEAHATGDHHGSVMELDGVHAGCVWTRWTGDHLPTTVFVLPDCEVTSSDGMDGCGIFGGHPGAHTWEMEHPLFPRG
jgi:hypothetical protein